MGKLSFTILAVWVVFVIFQPQVFAQNNHKNSKHQSGTYSEDMEHVDKTDRELIKLDD